MRESEDNQSLDFKQGEPLRTCVLTGAHMMAAVQMCACS